MTATGRGTTLLVSMEEEKQVAGDDGVDHRITSTHAPGSVAEQQQVGCFAVGTSIDKCPVFCTSLACPLAPGAMVDLAACEPHMMSMIVGCEMFCPRGVRSVSSAHPRRECGPCLKPHVKDL